MPRRNNLPPKLATRVANGRPSTKGTGLRMESQGDTSVLKYDSYIGNDNSDDGGYNDYWRPYILGCSTWPGGYGGSATISTSSSSGQVAANCFSSGKFLPGTFAEWVPNVGFTTNGRMWVAFTDNVETAYNYMRAGTAGNLAAKVTIIKRMANSSSFPIYEHARVRVPVEMSRLKYYNTNLLSTNPEDEESFMDQLQRSAQLFMLACASGVPVSADVGTFHFHDVARLRGLGSHNTN